LRRGVLFDFDGTLIDTWRLYLESFRRSLEPHFQRLLTDPEILDYQPIAERRLLHEIVERARFTDYFESFFSHYRSLHETHCDGLYQGTLDLLNGLRADGYTLGIVTGKSRAAWNITFGHSNLEPFDVVITDEDVTEPKPHPEGLVAALRAMDVEPSHAFYIGDSLLDCRAAHAAKIRFGAALWSKSPCELEPFRKAVGALGDALYFSDPPSVRGGLKHWKVLEIRPLDQQPLLGGLP
jgi:HAD superfamily hydrolase (TIGR01549 family)